MPQTADTRHHGVDLLVQEHINVLCMLKLFTSEGRMERKIDRRTSRSVSPGEERAEPKGKGEVEPLLLHIKRSQLRWLGHLYRMAPGCLPLEVFLACPTRRRPRGRLKTRWSDYGRGKSPRLSGRIWMDGILRPPHTGQTSNFLIQPLSDHSVASCLTRLAEKLHWNTPLRHAACCTVACTFCACARCN